jgi:antitoxin component YwqK of YwqJK toxin-antitoxin module
MRGKLFIPRKLSVDDSRYLEWNNSQVVVNGVRINQYDSEGRKQGLWMEYWGNGKIYSKGSYINDVQDGYWEWYHDNGKLWLKELYKNGYVIW